MKGKIKPILVEVRKIESKSRNFDRPVNAFGYFGMYIADKAFRVQNFEPKFSNLLELPRIPQQALTNEAAAITKQGWRIQNEEKISFKR